MAASADPAEAASTAAGGAVENSTSRRDFPATPFLRVPPFPGCRNPALAWPAQSDRPGPSSEVAELLELIRQQRVGGTYWASQPQLPPPPYLLARTSDRACLSELLRSRRGERIVWWAGKDAGAFDLDRENLVIARGDCDPWHLMSGASEVIVDEDDELALLAAIAGLPLTTVGHCNLTGPELKRLAANALRSFDYVSPFTREPIRAAEAIALCGFWRKLIDSNRSLTGAVGFAFWKRPTVTPLLWAGSGDVPFVSTSGSQSEKSCVAIWRSRTPQPLLAELEAKDIRLIEVEDGFIRSSGLGADCVAPLSIVVDALGVHFDPARPSELERIIETGAFSPELIERARQLRAAIVAAGLSKYERGREPAADRGPGQRVILVAGQVEDDRAVVDGGCGLASNIELLRRVRRNASDAHIIYKPHPDIEAGHRRGAIPDRICLGLADEIVREESISSLLDRVDEVHVNTSLAGFEALLREKAVTTYGVPFYAGWGLTTDLGPIPARRTAKRTLDELVAATLLLYPRYLDPRSGLPCPPEILISRLSDPAATTFGDGIVVRLRRIQGRWRRRLQSIRRRISK